MQLMNETVTQLGSPLGGLVEAGDDTVGRQTLAGGQHGGQEGDLAVLANGGLDFLEKLQLLVGLVHLG